MDLLEMAAWNLAHGPSTFWKLHYEILAMGLLETNIGSFILEAFKKFSTSYCWGIESLHMKFHLWVDT